MNTAIDFYSRGKEKEAEAKDYSTFNFYPRGRFICPECGEDVYLSKSKYKNFFKHYKRTSQTPECERRVDSVPNESIYERIGLPLYLREEAVGHFKIYIGFQAISEEDLERAERDQCELWVNRRIKYRINRERFSCTHSYWMPVDFSPYDDHYTISYIGSQVNRSVFEKNWGDYAEAFLEGGALFKAEGGSGRKLHKGDSIATDTNYYWAVRSDDRLNKLRGMQYKLCGKLSLTNCTYNIFRVVFRSKISDEDFEVLSRFLLKELKVHLLEKAADLTPVWPPLIKQGDRFIVSENILTIYSAVESGNTFPFVFGYYKNDPTLLYLNSRDSSIIQLPIEQRHQYFTVDRKNVSTGLIIEKGWWSTDGCCKNISLSVNGESVNVPGEFTFNESAIVINITPGADIILKRKNSVECLRKQTEYEIKALTPSDKVLIINGSEFLLLAQRNESDNAYESSENVKELEYMFKKYGSTYKVSIPLEMRRLLLMYYHRTTFADKILTDGEIPLALMRYIERHIYVQQRHR